MANGLNSLTCPQRQTCSPIRPCSKIVNGSFNCRAYSPASKPMGPAPRTAMRGVAGGMEFLRVMRSFLGQHDAIVDIRQLKHGADRADDDAGLQSSMKTIHPLTVGLAVIVLHLRLVLGDEYVIGECRVVPLEAMEFFASVECFGGL